MRPDAQPSRVIHGELMALGGIVNSVKLIRCDCESQDKVSRWQMCLFLTVVKANCMSDWGEKVVWILKALLLQRDFVLGCGFTGCFLSTAARHFNKTKMFGRAVSFKRQQFLFHLNCLPQKRHLFLEERADSYSLSGSSVHSADQVKTISTKQGSVKISLIQNYECAPVGCTVLGVIYTLLSTVWVSC